jgi:hypothetical protein
MSPHLLVLSDQVESIQGWFYLFFVNSYFPFSNYKIPYCPQTKSLVWPSIEGIAPVFTALQRGCPWLLTFAAAPVNFEDINRRANHFAAREDPTGQVGVDAISNNLYIDGDDPSWNCL